MAYIRAFEQRISHTEVQIVVYTAFDKRDNVDSFEHIEHSTFLCQPRQIELRNSTHTVLVDDWHARNALLDEHMYDVHNRRVHIRSR